MKIERDERKFDFHDIGLAIKKAREREGLTQEQLAYIVDRDTRTIMYHENDGQHPSLSQIVSASMPLCTSEQASERAHFAAPPFQTEPAVLGFGLVNDIKKSQIL